MIIQGANIIELYSRWLLLSWILTFRMVSKPLYKKYPDLVSLQRDGMLFA